MLCPLLGLNLQELQGKDRKTTGVRRTTGTEGEIRARQKVTLIAGIGYPPYPKNAGSAVSARINIGASEASL